MLSSSIDFFNKTNRIQEVYCSSDFLVYNFQNNFLDERILASIHIFSDIALLRTIPQIRKTIW